MLNYKCTQLANFLTYKFWSCHVTHFENSSSEKMACTHCSIVFQPKSGEKTIRCPECKTLLKIDKTEIQKINSARIKELRNSSTLKRTSRTASRTKSTRKFEIAGEQENKIIPRQHKVMCKNCKQKVNVKKDVGKYRCPKCSTLLVYVKDATSAYYLGAVEAVSFERNSEKNSEFTSPPKQASSCHVPKTSAPKKLGLSQPKSEELHSSSFSGSAIHGLAKNIGWLLQNLLISYALWVTSSLIAVSIRDLGDPTGNLIITILWFTGSMYASFRLQEGATPPSYQYEEGFLLVLGLCVFMIMPALGGLSAAYLFY